MIEKVTISKRGLMVESFTPKEIIQRGLDKQLIEEQVFLNSLVPSNEEILQAEFELKTLNLLMEVGLL